MPRPLNWTSSGSTDWMPLPLPAPSAARELVAEIERRSVPWHPSGDRILFHEGDSPAGLYLVRTGQVDLALLSSNDAFVCFRIGPDSLIGISAILGKRPYAMTAVASEDAEIAEINATAFLAFIENRPELYLKVLQILATETLSAYKVLAAMLLER